METLTPDVREDGRREKVGCIDEQMDELESRRRTGRFARGEGVDMEVGAGLSHGRQGRDMSG